MAYMVKHFDGNFAFDMLMLLNLGYRPEWGKQPTKIYPVVSLTCANTQKQNFPSRTVTSPAKSPRVRVNSGSGIVLAWEILTDVHTLRQKFTLERVISQSVCRVSAQYISDLQGVFTV